MVYVVIGLVVVMLGFVAWLFTAGRRAGSVTERADAQEKVIDEQTKVQAARVATADPSTGRAGRLRDRFTRK